MVVIFFHIMFLNLMGSSIGEQDCPFSNVAWLWNKKNKKNPVSFSLLQHRLSSHLPRPSASVLISLCHLSSVTIWFDAYPVCRGAAPCSPHRSPFRSSLNPADHNRAGFQGGSQSTPNTPKVRLLRPCTRRGAYVTSVSVL